MGNALKFTEQGSIVVIVELGTDKDGEINLIVKDSGVGMSAATKNRLFTAFSQADSSITRTYGGTGLGLTISKQLALLMGGDIGIDSELGKGSSFWVKLHLPKDPKIEPMHNQNMPLNAKQILLVASPDEYRTVMSKVATHRGMALDYLVSADEALAYLAEKNSDNKAYDLVIYDVDQAGSDSMVLVNSLAQHVPTLAVISAGALPSKDTLMLANNNVHFMAKPLAASEFNALVLTTLGLVVTERINDQRSAEQQKEHQAIIDEVKKLRILVVDDNAINRMVMAGMLKKCHQTAVYAENGLEAVNAMT